MRLPHGGVLTIDHENFSVQEFWHEITCDKHNPIVDNHGSRVAYSTSGSKATTICNPGFFPTQSSLGIRAKAEPV